MTTNIANHDFLANDDLTDCAANIAYYLGKIKTPGGETFTADVVATVPVTIQGASSAQTGDLLDVKQNSGGNMLFKIATVASAVNGASLTAAATGSAPTIAAIGTDTNVSLNLQGKGTGSVTLIATAVGNVAGTIQGAAAAQTGDLLDVYQTAGGSLLFQLTTVASAVNGIKLNATATGTAPTIAVQGTDTNIGLTILPKGTGTVVIQGGGTTPGAAATFTGVNTAVNGLNVTNAATGAGPILAALGTDTNIPLNLNAKGTGTVAITAQAVTAVAATINGTSTAQTGDLLDLVQNSGGNILHKFATVASAVNGLSVTASATGNAVLLASQGTDTNIPMQINPKGTGTVTFYSGVATPAAGLATAGILFGTAGIGFFWGSGAPTFNAPIGSVYMRTDGSSTSTRLYVATSAAGAWTNFTSAA